MLLKITRMLPGSSKDGKAGKEWLPLATLMLGLLVPATGTCQQAAPVPPKAQAGAPQPAGPNAAEAHLSRGYDALKEDRYNIAADEFRAALALDPKLILRARFPLAIALFEMHKNDDARRELEAVRQEVGDHANIMYYLGRVDLEDHNFKQAIGHFTKAAAKPPFPDTAYYLGFAYFKHGDLAAAEEWLRKAEVATPHDSRVPYQLGFVYRQKGEQQESAKAFALASQLRHRDADEARIQSECAQTLQQGKREEAHAVCNQLYDDNDAERLTELGTLYGQHGDFEAALKPLRRAAELAPQSPQMQFNLAMVYFQLNRPGEARAPLHSALQRWPDLFQLNALYGAVLLKLGEELPAYQALRHAHELNPSDSGTVDLLYTAAMALGKTSGASRHYANSLHYYREAAKWRPAEPAPHQAMAKIYALTGKPSQAQAEEQVANRLARNSAAGHL
jgi:tetratricopeptide (TPR) repeat protein